ncbi:putative ribonuclease T(2) [Lupinus albus]|uniref:Putative ribonuclease T(2) n=1 Tax=Lupinus albus TaxID=3870 RepID=A0A6A4Q3B5_LUPAL|nr:putative ribonuclease T(2) [Lupinus albus]
MNQYWISLKKQNFLFWSREWKHHGSCANKDVNTSLNVEEYFSKTMDAYFKYKIQDVLIPLGKSSYLFIYIYYYRIVDQHNDLHK